MDRWPSHEGSPPGGKRASYRAGAPDDRRRREARRDGRAGQRPARPGPGRRGIRRGVCALDRRRACHRGVIGHGRPAPCAAGAWGRFWRRGDHDSVHVHRLGECGAVHRGHAGLRRRRAGHVLHRSRARRGGDHNAHARHPSRPSIWASGGDDRAERNRTPAPPGPDRRRMPGARCDGRRAQSRRARAHGCLLALPDQEHDIGRGWLRDH